MMQPGQLVPAEQQSLAILSNAVDKVEYRVGKLVKP